MPQCVLRAQPAWREAHWCRSDRYLKNHLSAVNNVAVQRWQPAMNAWLRHLLTTVSVFGMGYNFALDHLRYLRYRRHQTGSTQHDKLCLHLCTHCCSHLQEFCFVNVHWEGKWSAGSVLEPVTLWTTEMQKRWLIEISLLTKFLLALVTLLSQ